MNVRSAAYNIQDLVEIRRQELKEKKGNLPLTSPLFIE